MKDTWTDLRIEIENCINNLNLEIIPLNIIKWNEIEHKIINHFTGTDGGFTWMWENKILKKFDFYAEQITDFDILIKILSEIINKNGVIWVFIEDTLNYETKYW